MGDPLKGEFKNPQIRDMACEAQTKISFTFLLAQYSQPSHRRVGGEVRKSCDRI